MNSDFPGLEDRFIRAVRESYANYNRYGARSLHKLRPLHQWVADEMQRALGQEYVMQSLRKETPNGEATIAGKYYAKKVDVSISHLDERPLAVISVKFITSNFKQNANNYFEHLMGETANIRRNNFGFGHLMVIPNVIPYLSRGGGITHGETIKDAHLEKYVRLAQDNDYPHRPDVMGIGIVTLPLDNLQQTNRIELQDLHQMSVDAQIQAALAGEFSVSSFINKMKIMVEERV